MTESSKSGRKAVIGLMGGVGSGKSTAARLLGGMGCAVIDADALARQAMQQPTIVQRVMERFGTADRAQLAAKVFQDEQALRDLEAIIHPFVHEQRQRLRSAAMLDPRVVAIVEDVPLLMETGQAGACDVRVFIEAEEGLRLRRVAEHRGWDAQELLRRQSRQIGLDIKRQAADYVISNNGDEASLAASLRHLLSRITQST